MPTPDDKITITAYVTAAQKARFLAVRQELARTVSLPQTALAQVAISQFLDKYAEDVAQLVLDLGFSNDR